jgi:hypothetical protein
MVIQEREADLVIGTFGRSIYVLDDIRPLRVFAKNTGKTPTEKLTAIASPDAYQAEIHQPHGERFPASGKYAAENREFGGSLSFILNDPGKEKLDSVVVSIFNEQGEQIRTIKRLPTQGVNKVSWNLDRKSSVETPSFGGGGGGGQGGRSRGFYEASGGDALPGRYKVVFKYGEDTAETSIMVYSDPRIQPNLADLKAREEFIKQTEALSGDVMKATRQLDDAKKTIDKLLAYAKDVDNEEVKALVKLANETKKKVDTTREAFYGPTREGQGIVRNLYPTTMTRLFAPRSYANSSNSAPGPTEMRLLQQAKESAESALKVWNTFFENDWKQFEEKAKATQIDIFKEIEKVEVK